MTVATKTKYQKGATKASLNPRIFEAQYAVRGEIVQLASSIQAKLTNGEPVDGDFKEVIFCNVGNPQQLGNKPYTYLRQLLALTEYPPLADHEDARRAFPEDVIAHSKEVLKMLGTGQTGAYTHSKGASGIREHVVRFLEERDGFDVDAENVYLLNGSSTGITNLFEVLLSGDKDGVLIPVPQYPLYSALLALHGTEALTYYLDESDAWTMNLERLQRTVDDARARGLAVKAFVVVNPGNPAGQCLSEQMVKECVKFAHRNSLVVVADEVYQENIYGKGKKFVSFKRAAFELGEQYKEVEIASFHSTSKGLMGECGKRGGFVEFSGFTDEVMEQVLKLASMQLCPNTVGQVTTEFLVNPPRPGSASFERYEAEREEFYESYRKRAEMLAARLNEIEGMTCNAAQGAMYVFPRISLPEKACEQAKKEQRAPDALYAKQLLCNHGICVVPGNGFGEEDGTYHFRTTILPLEDKLEYMVDKLAQHHKEFVEQYS